MYVYNKQAVAVKNDTEKRRDDVLRSMMVDDSMIRLWMGCE